MGQKVISPIGANPSRVDASAAFALGERCYTEDGKEYVYVQASGALTGAGYIAAIDVSTYTAVELTTTNGASHYGWPVGVEPAAVADTYFCWLQVRGAASVQCLASAAKGVQLNSTATAGALDDDGTAGARLIDGLGLTAANAAAQGNAAAVLTYPTIGATHG